MDERRAAARETVLDAIERFGPDVSFARLARLRPGLGGLLADRPAMTEAVLRWITQRLSQYVGTRVEGIPRADAPRFLAASVEAYLEWMETHPNTCRFALRHGYTSMTLSDILRSVARDYAVQILQARTPAPADADLMPAAIALTGAAEAVGVWWIRQDFQPSRAEVGGRLTRQLLALVEAV